MKWKASLLSLAILVVLLAIWQVATMSSASTTTQAGMTPEQIEYQKMLGKDPGQVKSAGFPTPGERVRFSLTWPAMRAPSANSSDGARSSNS